MATATVPRTILASGIMVELFGLFIGLSFQDRIHSISSPMLSHIVQGTLTSLLVVGVLGLASTVIIITVQICLGVAVVMASTFIAGSIVSLLLLWFFSRG